MTLAALVPGLTGAVVSKAVDGPYYRMTELLCPDMATLGAALVSAEGLAVAADAERLQQVFGNKLDVLIVGEE